MEADDLKIKFEMNDNHENLNKTLFNTYVENEISYDGDIKLNIDENNCMLGVMSMDRLIKNDGENGIKYYRIWTDLVNLINTLFLSGSPEDKKYSKYFINRMAFWLGKQCLDNPYIYVSHGPNHSFEVVGYLEMLYNISPIIKKSLSDLYGLQYEGMYKTNIGHAKSVMNENIIFTKIVLKLLALLHDVGYSDVSENIENPHGKTVEKWVHAMSGVKTIIPEIEEFLKKCIDIINSIYDKPDDEPEDKPEWRSEKIYLQKRKERQNRHKLEEKKLNLISDFKKAIWYHNADCDKCNWDEFKKQKTEENKKKWIEKYLGKCTFSPSRDQSSKLFPSIHDETVYREYYEGDMINKPFIYLIRSADNLDFTRNRMVNTHKNINLIQLIKNLYILGETLGENGKKSPEGKNMQKYLVDEFEKKYTNEDKQLSNVITMFKELKTDKGWVQFEHWYSVFCVLSSDVQSVDNSGRLLLNVYLDGNLRGDLNIESNKWMSLNQITRLKDSLDSIKSPDNNPLTDLITVKVYKRSQSNDWEIVGKNRKRNKKKEKKSGDELLYNFTLSDIVGEMGPRPSGSDGIFLQNLKKRMEKTRLEDDNEITVAPRSEDDINKDNFISWGKGMIRNGGDKTRRKIKKTKKTKKKKKKARRKSRKKYRRKSRR